MSCQVFFYLPAGNRKRDSNPLPKRPRKIKRVNSETFLRIKQLLENIVRPQVNKKQIYRIKPAKVYKESRAVQFESKDTFEPSNINNTRDSLFWRWRRVAEWEKYINDPLEKIKRAPYNLL